MKLGMVISEFPTQTHIFFWREIQALTRSGIDVSIISTRKPKDVCPHPFAVEAVARTRYLFPPTTAAARGLATSVGASPGRLAAAARYLESIDRGEGLRRLQGLAYLASAAELVAHARAEGLDHIHVHSCAATAHMAALAFLLGGPTYSLHLHGDLPVYGRDHQQKMAHALFVAAAARPMQQQVVDEVGVPASRTCTLIMGVETARFVPAPGVPRSGPLQLITVGRLALCKGHRHALAAIRRLLDQRSGASAIDVRYDLVGQGPDRAAIEADVARLGLSDRVRFLGSLGEDQIAERLRQSHAFVLSSVGVGEASPVAVMEAMASGLPVICSRIGGTADMIDDGVDGLLVDQGDEAGLAHAMARLHDGDAFRMALGLAARQRASRQFDAGLQAERLVTAIHTAKAHGDVSAAVAYPPVSRRTAA